MATVMEKETHTRMGSETGRIQRGRTPRIWLLAVLLALIGGVVAGAVGWQATRSDPTTATRKLAERYAAAGFFTPAQAAMFAPNGKLVDATLGEWSQGHVYKKRGSLSALLYVGTIEEHMQSHHQVQYTAKQRVAVVGSNGFVTQWTLRGTNLAGQPMVLHGASVCTVKDGKITLETFYYDVRTVIGR